MLFSTSISSSGHQVRFLPIVQRRLLPMQPPFGLGDLHALPNTGRIRSDSTTIALREPRSHGQGSTGDGILKRRRAAPPAVAMITGRVLTAVVGGALYLTVAGLTGVALGALLCNIAAAITTFVGVFS